VVEKKQRMRKNKMNKITKTIGTLAAIAYLGIVGCNKNPVSSGTNPTDTLSSAKDTSSIDTTVQNPSVISDLEVTLKVKPNPNDKSIMGYVATANDRNGTISKYEWDFNNDGIADTTVYSSNTLNMLIKKYEQSGNYTAIVKVTDDKGATASDSATVNITKPDTTVENTVKDSTNSGMAKTAPMIATFSANPSSTRVGQPVAFIASAYDADGNIKSYYWDFGDGQTKTSSTGAVTHTYTTPDNYAASVTVTDNDGLQVLEIEMILVNQ
jgi:large repetitive protein